MRIGIDFDNTIACYDDVFCQLAKSWQLIPTNFQGNRMHLRNVIHSQPNGDSHWQRMQGKIYGELMHHAILFDGFKEFIETCNTNQIEIFIVSHKTQYGHFDESGINLHSVTLDWLNNQGIINGEKPLIPRYNIFFEPTREHKILRIQSLNCSHFIDDLVDVFTSPLFPKTIQKILFGSQTNTSSDINCFSNWNEIQNAIFAN